MPRASAGNLYSTSAISPVERSLFAGKVLSEYLEGCSHRCSPAKTAAQRRRRLRLRLGHWARGLHEISHGGGLHGFNSYLLRITDPQFTVVVLVNALPPPPGLEAASIAQEIAALYLWEKMAARPVLVAKSNVAPAVLDLYVGRYEYPGGAIMTVTRQDNRLFAQLTAQPRIEIFPKSESEFFWKVVEAEVQFVKDDKGRVVKAVHRQGGQTLQCPKQRHAVAKVDSAHFAPTWAPTFGHGLVVTGRTGYSAVSGPTEIECSEVRDRVLPWGNAQIVFAKEKDGKVKNACSTGGMKLKVPRAVNARSSGVAIDRTVLQVLNFNRYGAFTCQLPGSCCPFLPLNSLPSKASHPPRAAIRVGDSTFRPDPPRSIRPRRRQGGQYNDKE